MNEYGFPSSHPSPHHRKPRTRRHPHAPAAVVTTAALSSLGLLLPHQAAAAPAPRPSVEEVRTRVDELHRQAGTATQAYDAAAGRTEAQRALLSALMDQIAGTTQKLNEARRLLGSYAADRYRGAGGLGGTATLLLSDDPQAFFTQTHLLNRLGGREDALLNRYIRARAETAGQRREAAVVVGELERAQEELRGRKQEVQARLAEANTLLARLTAPERARALAPRAPAASGPLPSDAAASASGARAVAFARAQLGKPYVWGATGPRSYDCSGLTQAAWRAAGITLPRTTWDQVKAAPRIATKDLRPGDLVFFYSDISHVGIYIGGGRMIHAPRPGTSVREDSVYYQPIYGSVRPG
ncbi:NlpC/P60 family protein [Streptomyces sp. NBC_00335]|uniref:C40 family peptidase n=1 Tax=unclassified Streptomyces TaxID=2593676 RepID=UPI0022574E28|nr:MULTISPECIES: C40 family peptidase [unclassified Streptomyces]MCX5405120.1 NlpC/P60 family protein [Streptomyces sp. NBC_00086]